MSLKSNNPIATKDKTGIVIKFLRAVISQFFTTFLGKKTFGVLITYQSQEN